MPGASKDKVQLGYDFVDQMDGSYHCRNFTHAKPLACNCCATFAWDIVQVCNYLKNLCTEFWNLEDTEQAPADGGRKKKDDGRKKAAVVTKTAGPLTRSRAKKVPHVSETITNDNEELPVSVGNLKSPPDQVGESELPAVRYGKRLAVFLEKYCTFLNQQRPRYEFRIDGGITFSLCLATTVRVFGLPAGTHQIVHSMHTGDKKRIGLSMLKFFARKFTNKKDHMTFYNTFRSWFPQEVIPVSPRYVQAFNVIQKVLRGKIVELNDSAKSSLQYILHHHYTTIGDQRRVTFGGENIVFGPPRGMKEWDDLDHEHTRPLLHALKGAISELWVRRPAAIEYFKYKMANLYSNLGPANPTGTPQLAHRDFAKEAVDITYDVLDLKPMIAFVPMDEDGCMLLIWLDEYKKWQVRTHGPPYKYYLYIPYGTMVLLPGDIVHAGGFCFSSTNPNAAVKLPRSIRGYTNPRLHFLLCPDVVSHTAADSGKNEVFVDREDNQVPDPRNDSEADGVIREKDYPSYVLEDENMSKLRDCLLQEYIDPALAGGVGPGVTVIVGKKRARQD